MRCEVVAVGTELLLGQIVDSNSSWIGEQLALSGIDCHRHTRVGDNLQRIVEVLRESLQRADAVIVCGGLGPTQDDITRDAIARVMDVALRRDPAMEEHISAYFRERGREMPANNLRQAELPEGARFMEVMPGTAPGLICPVGQRVVYAVPGVPSEMRAMVDEAVLPDLRRRSGSRAVIRSRVLKTWGVSESRLAEMLAHRVAALEGRGNPTLAFLASGAQGIKVRITAKGESAAQADKLLAAEERPVRDALGDIVFAVDDQTMEEVVLAMLRERGLSLGCAESLTGGLLGGRITAAPGASDVYVGGLVAYQGRIKHQLLEVPDGPVVSAQAAEAMASGARRLLGCDVALATTGVAGPDPQEDQPVGTVFIALAMGDELESHLLRLPGRRQLIREFTVISALEMLRRRLGRTPAHPV